VNLVAAEKVTLDLAALAIASLVFRFELIAMTWALACKLEDSRAPDLEEQRRIRRSGSCCETAGSPPGWLT
jgi:hypothetical protein